MEKTIEKIKKLLALASNNPSENEAMAAALKAQALMAEYNITEAQLGEEVKEIDEIKIGMPDGHIMKKWRISLALALGKNFRCKVYMMNGEDIVFYGYKQDIAAAAQVYHFLFETGNKLANRFYYAEKKAGHSTSGLLASYLTGFVRGIESELDKQCKALMIITPKEVTDGFAELTKGYKTKSVTNNRSNYNAFTRGHLDGREAVQARRLQ